MPERSAISKKELLYFSLKNQHLLKKADKSTVVFGLCGLQAQFANNPKYALRIRADDFSETGWGEGLVKIWSFRRTLHAVKADEIGLFLSARGVPDDWEDLGVNKEVKPYWSRFIYESISEGINSREELKERCLKKGVEPEMLEKIFDGWGGLIKEMCDRGMIAYDIGTAKRFVVCGNLAFSGVKEARAQFIRRYFGAFAPATVNDCASFTGYKKRDILGLIEEFGIPLKSITCEGVEYFYINDLSGDCKIPACIFLTGFDQMIMGYRDRSRLMEDKNKRDVITNTGIVYPTILLDGKLQARWRKDGAKLVITPFGKLSEQSRDIIITNGKELFSDEKVEILFQD